MLWQSRTVSFPSGRHRPRCVEYTPYDDRGRVPDGGAVCHQHCADHSLWLVLPAQMCTLFPRCPYQPLCSVWLILPAEERPLSVELSVLFLPNSCKSDFPVCWALLPSGDPGKEHCLEMPPSASSAGCGSCSWQRAFQTSSAVHTADLTVASLRP